MAVSISTSGPPSPLATNRSGPTTARAAGWTSWYCELPRTPTSAPVDASSSVTDWPKLLTTNRSGPGQCHLPRPVELVPGTRQHGHEIPRCDVDLGDRAPTTAGARARHEQVGPATARADGCTNL